MKLKDLINLIGSDDQIIYLLVNNEWCGAFYSPYSPQEYEDYIVEALMAESFKGESPFDGAALKVWIRNEDE